MFVTVATMMVGASTAARTLQPMIPVSLPLVAIERAHPDQSARSSVLSLVIIFCIDRIEPRDLFLSFLILSF